MLKTTDFVTEVRDRLLLSDPCLARLVFAGRALLGLVAVAVVIWFLSDTLGHDISGVLLGVIASQFSVLLARQPERRARIATSFIMIPGYWLGLVLIHAIAGHPVLQIATLPLMVGLGFWLQDGRSTLATMFMAAAWIFMFTIYFQAQNESLIWHMVAIGVSVPLMMAVRFLIWPDDRPVSQALILRSHQLILVRAAERVAGSAHRADVFGWLHKSMVPVIQALQNHPDVDADTRAALLDQRRTVEIELLRAPERGLEIARVLDDKPCAGGAELGLRLPALNRPVEPVVEEKPGRVSNSSANLSHRRAIQVTAAVVPAAFAGFLVSPERWPWAVLVAMFMFFGTENSGRIFSKGVQNILGVILGLMFAVVLSDVLPPVLWIEFAAIMVLTFLAFYLIPVQYGMGMAAVTALIAQAFALGREDVTVLLQFRLTEVLTGAAFGLFAGLFVMPEKASYHVRRSCERLLNDVADVLDPDQAGPGMTRLREDLEAAYSAADFGRLEGLMIDGAGMRVALIEMAQLQYLIGIYMHLEAHSDVQVPVHYRRELARRCRAVAARVVHCKQAVPGPLSLPENDDASFGVLAAIDASVEMIARQA